jgi:DNA-binding CsgD family transcriptional regulator
LSCGDPLARGRRLSSRGRFLEAIAAMWDLLSEETAARLLTELKPSSSQEADEDRLRSVWAVLAIRVPEVWAAKFATLEPAAQSALLDSLSPTAAAFLPAELTEPLLLLAKTRLLDGSASENVYLLYVSLLHRTANVVVDGEVLEVLRRARPEIVARLGWLDLDLIGIDAVKRAAEGLRRQVLAENEEARKGTIVHRTFDCRLRLGQALALLPSPPKHLTQVLLDTAMDGGVVADYRLSALRGLAILAQADVLDAELARPLAQIPPLGEPSWFSNVSDRLFEAAVRAVTALAAPRDDDDVALLNSSRDPDDRVRDLAVEAASRVVRRRKPTPEADSSTLTIALFGALFDPVETVLLHALEAVPTLFNERLRGVLTERLEALFASSVSNVRAAVADVAVQLSANGTTSALSRIIDLARNDRSWKVRNTVRNQPAVEPLAEQELAKSAAEPRASLSTAAAALGLTRRELEVLALVAAGRTNQQIGEALSVSPKTASAHVSRILTKLGAGDRGKAAEIAYRLGLTTPKTSN